MQKKMNAAKGFVANLYRIIASWTVERGDEWDRVYLCSAAPLGAEFVRDYEQSERHHHQW